MRYYNSVKAALCKSIAQIQADANFQSTFRFHQAKLQFSVAEVC